MRFLNHKQCKLTLNCLCIGEVTNEKIAGRQSEDELLGAAAMVIGAASLKAAATDDSLDDEVDAENLK